jgi:hypothetical protein
MVAALPGKDPFAVGPQLILLGKPHGFLQRLTPSRNCVAPPSACASVPGSPKPAQVCLHAWNDAANTIIRNRPARFLALIDALKAHPSPNICEVNELWRSGAFTFRSRIGKILYDPSRGDLSSREYPLPATAPQFPPHSVAA